MRKLDLLLVPALLLGTSVAYSQSAYSKNPTQAQTAKRDSIRAKQATDQRGLRKKQLPKLADEKSYDAAKAFFDHIVEEALKQKKANGTENDFNYPNERVQFKNNNGTELTVTFLGSIMVTMSTPDGKDNIFLFTDSRAGVVLQGRIELKSGKKPLFAIIDANRSSELAKSILNAGGELTGEENKEFVSFFENLAEMKGFHVAANEKPVLRDKGAI